MQIETEKTGGVLLFVVTGRVDAATCNGLEVDLLGAIEGGEHRLLVDCSRLQYISSAGLRIFLLAAKKLKAVHGRIVLCSLQPHIKTMFEIAGFTAAFPIEETREEGIKLLTG